MEKASSRIRSRLDMDEGTRLGAAATLSLVLWFTVPFPSFVP